MYFLNKKNNKTMYNWRRHWRFHHEQMTDAGCYCLVHAAIFWFFQLAFALHQSTWTVYITIQGHRRLCGTADSTSASMWLSGNVLFTLNKRK